MFVDFEQINNYIKLISKSKNTTMSSDSKPKKYVITYLRKPCPITHYIDSEGIVHKI